MMACFALRMQVVVCLYLGKKKEESKSITQQYILLVEPTMTPQTAGLRKKSVLLIGVMVSLKFTFFTRLGSD